MLNTTPIFAAMTALVLASGGLTDDQVKWLATGFAAVVAIAAGGYYVTGSMANVKKLREKPVEPSQFPQPLMVQLAEEFATVEALKALERVSSGRYAENKASIDKLERQFDGRHRENIAAIGALGKTLNGYLVAAAEKREALLKDVRHEVSGVVNPMRLETTASIGGIHERINKIAEEMPTKIIQLLRDTNMVGGHSPK